MPSTIFVTGGAGFIGSHVCDALLARGDRVTAFDNFDPFYDLAIKRRNLSGCVRHGHFTLIEGDIRDPHAVDAAMRAARPDVIIHLAARAGVRPSIEQPLLYQDVNVGGTAVLLDAARRHEIRRLIFASSSSVYGNNAKVPFHESDPADRPISPYAVTKRAGELLCHTYHHLFGIDITCLRLFTTYGPRQRPDLAIHKFARRIAAGEAIPVFGDGGTSRDYTYVADIVGGILSATDRCRGFHVYNLGGGHPVALRELIAALEAALGCRGIIDRQPPQPGDVERTFADIGLARAELGYDPKTTLAAGLARFVAWLRSDAS